jgi:hypothetical protein
VNSLFWFGALIPRHVTFPLRRRLDIKDALFDFPFSVLPASIPSILHLLLHLYNLVRLIGLAVSLLSPFLFGRKLWLSSI